MRIIIIAFFALVSFQAFSQTDSILAVKDTLAPFQKTNAIPTFSLQQPDSSWFFNTSLQEKKPVLILYFSPDCGHCQLETDEILGHINKLQDLQIVMVTSRPFEDLAKFVAHYKIYKFPTIKIGRDPSYTITKFYDVKFTPFSALYNKNGKLEKTYTKGIDMEELIKLVQ
jgi:thiol-disulfide isomerase/thioredoxin